MTRARAIAACAALATALATALLAPGAGSASDAANRALMAEARSFERLIEGVHGRPLQAFEVASPLPYWREIAHAAGRHAIPEPFIAAVIHCESAWDARALSRAGARGLMQVMPATARAEFGLPALLLWDPAINVEAGTAYLRRLADRYDGRIADVLAAYNAGPGRLERGSPLPRETRRYVACVAQSHALYAEYLRSWTPMATRTGGSR